MFKSRGFAAFINVALFAAFLILHYNKMMTPAAICLVSFSLVFVFTVQT